MTKPHSGHGYRLRWHQLATDNFETEDMDYFGYSFSDIDACTRCEMKTLRAFLIECFIDSLEDSLQYSGLARNQILEIAASRTGIVDLDRAKHADRETLQVIVFGELSHWKLSKLGYQIADHSVKFLPNIAELLEPYRPEEISRPDL